MKPWIGCEIRLLRTQLGWSRVRMAKELGCSPLKVVKLEGDEIIPLAQEKSRLETLSMQVENRREISIFEAHAESYMIEHGIDQVHQDEVTEDFFQNLKSSRGYSID